MIQVVLFGDICYQNTFITAHVIVPVETKSLSRLVPYYDKLSLYT